MDSIVSQNVELSRVKIKHLKNILLIAQKNLLGKPPPFLLIVKSLQSTISAEKMTLVNI
jgi:hypothetical protein